MICLLYTSQLFQSGFQRLSGTLQLFDVKTLAATGLYLCNPLSDLVDLFIEKPFLTLPALSLIHI